MTAIDFDTLKVSRSLRDAGMEERQAEAVTDAIKQSVKIENLVTKDDLRLTKDDLRSDFANLEQQLDSKLEASSTASTLG